MTDRPPYPPFDKSSAQLKVRLAEDAWNSQQPEKIALAYTPESEWRNRTSFITGRSAIEDFLTLKWKKELDYRLIKGLWAWSENKIAVRFAYEFQDASNNWFRAYGNENWEFDKQGLMARRFASINDVAIDQKDRKFLWPSGRRPNDHPGLSELDL